MENNDNLHKQLMNEVMNDESVNKLMEELNNLNTELMNSVDSEVLDKSNVKNNGGTFDTKINSDFDFINNNEDMKLGYDIGYFLSNVKYFSNLEANNNNLSGNTQKDYEIFYQLRESINERLDKRGIDTRL